MVTHPDRKEVIMPGNQIESRRAFFKKAGKALGAAALAAPFLAVAVTEMNPEDEKKEVAQRNCGGVCRDSCYNKCGSTCINGCYNNSRTRN